MYNVNVHVHVHAECHVLYTTCLANTMNIINVIIKKLIFSSHVQKNNYYNIHVDNIHIRLGPVAY